MEAMLVLTEEIVRDKARSYVPLAEKEAFVRSVSDNCFDRIAIGSGNGEDVPPMWKENGFIKARYLAGALVKLYFGLEYATEAGEEWLPTTEEYDRIMALCPMNQIERIRKSSKDAAVRDKCYVTTLWLVPVYSSWRTVIFALDTPLLINSTASLTLIFTPRILLPLWTNPRSSLWSISRSA